MGDIEEVIPEVADNNLTLPQAREILLRSWRIYSLGDELEEEIGDPTVPSTPKIQQEILAISRD